MAWASAADGSATVPGRTADHATEGGRALRISAGTLCLKSVSLSSTGPPLNWIAVM